MAAPSSHDVARRQQDKSWELRAAGKGWWEQASALTAACCTPPSACTSSSPLSRYNSASHARSPLCCTRSSASVTKRSPSSRCPACRHASASIPSSHGRWVSCPEAWLHDQPLAHLGQPCLLLALGGQRP